jgi:hypothetical protein
MISVYWGYTQTSLIGKGLFFMRAFIFISILLFSSASVASVYQKITDHIISYSDENSPGATVIEPAPLAVWPMKKSAAPLIEQHLEKLTPHQALPLELSGIKAGETIQHGQQLALSAQDKTAKTEILIDDKAVGSKWVADNLDRGAHRVQAISLDANRQIIDKTAEETFYVHQASTG